VPRLLLEAARRLDRADAAQVRAAHLDAIRAAVLAGGLAASGGTVAEVARAAWEAPTAGQPGPADLLLDGLASCLGGRGGAGGPAVRQAVDWFSRQAGPDDLRWLPLASIAALTQWDEVTWQALSGRFVRLARDTGALGDLALALNIAACGHLLDGDLDAAGSRTAEAAAVGGPAASRIPPYGALGLAALRGHPEPARVLIEEARRDAVARGEGLGAAAAQWAAAVLHNGLGQYGTALTAAADAIRYAGHCLLGCWGAAELTEAAARSGQPGQAADAVHCVSRAAAAAGSDWARGIQARSLALVTGDASAEGRYQAAIMHLGRSRARVDLARAHLLYGEWLRRENRRVDAREQLRRAYRMLSAMGADAFAERARRELLASGETLRRTAETDRDLTAQERQIALRARDGQTNTEIGTELFLSPRTVEWHLRKVFAKLGITSRRQLRHALRDSAVPCG
jgi:DNA-binding CsgD family transcriptional regulator